jgi:hypothetical protein
MFGHIDRGPAIFAADGEALQHADGDKQRWRQYADLRIVRQKADSDRGKAHDRDGEQKGALAALAVAEMAEHDGAERADEKSGCKCQKRENVTLHIARAGEEVLRDDGGE